jgi:GNAT superfamily N-acetyltransferase
MISVLPAARFFAAPQRPFDTERAVLGAGNLVREDEQVDGLSWVLADARVEAPHIAIVDGHVPTPRDVGARVLEVMRRARSHDRRFVVVEQVAVADAIGDALVAAGFTRADLRFYGVGTDVLAAGRRLPLEPLVGDKAWRAWAVVQRPILAEMIAPRPLTEAMIDRGLEFKRRQQRNSPPIRRFVGLDEDGAAIAMIGYAPFTTCDFGFARRGPLVRLRDVAVIPSARGRGNGLALLRALAARAIDECEATQIVIGGASDGAANALYQRAGAREIGAYAIFSTLGDLAGARAPGVSPLSLVRSR